MSFRLRCLFVLLFLAAASALYVFLTLEKQIVFYDKYIFSGEKEDVKGKSYAINKQSVSYYISDSCHVNIDKDDSNAIKDSAGVKMHSRPDGGVYYHPVNMMQWSLRLLCAYDNTKDPRYLMKAGKHAEKLSDIAHVIDGLPYFPYEFDFKVWGYDEALMKAPWYSGMAQGQALSLYSLLYSYTGEKKWLEAADKVFSTLLRGRENSPDVWVSYMDDSGYFWIEEYPMDRHPSNVLNGFLFAVFGVYDYYSVTSNVNALDMLNKSLNTVEYYGSKWRVVGNKSFYDLKYHRRANRGYHQLHIKQLKYLYKITNDKFFFTLSEDFIKDFNKKPAT